MITALLAFVASLLSAAPQDLPGAFPRDGATQLMDNERVTVWDVTWPKGVPTAMHRHQYDMVGVELADAIVKVTTLEGVATTAALQTGKALYLRKGTAHMEEGISDIGRHAILVDLKDGSAPASLNATVYPTAFPREGATKLIDNARVVVWDYAWTSGKPTPVHVHDKDSVVVYLGAGRLASRAR